MHRTIEPALNSNSMGHTCGPDGFERFDLALQCRAPRIQAPLLLSHRPCVGERHQPIQRISLAYIDRERADLVTRSR